MMESIKFLFCSLPQIELQNKESNGTMGKKENEKYSGVLEVDTIKLVVMKEKFQK